MKTKLYYLFLAVMWWRGCWDRWKGEQNYDSRSRYVPMRM